MLLKSGLKGDLVIAAILSSVLGILAFLVPKGSEVVWCVQYRTDILNTFFSAITYAGEAYVLFPLVCALVWLSRLPKREKWLIFGQLGIAYVLFMACIFGLKNYVFDLPRPAKYFAQIGIDLPAVGNRRLNTHHSFPSGHTASAWFSYFLCMYILKYVWGKTHFSILFLCLTMAILVGVSRIYLGQHFITDVWFGASIGWCFVRFTAYFLFEKQNKITESAV